MRINYFFDLSDFPFRAVFDDCEYPWEVLSKIHEYVTTRDSYEIRCDIPEGAFIEKPELISIGEGTIVEAGATIKGPCVIGRNCTIRQGAYVRGDFIAGDNALVGHSTEVKNAILLNGAKAAHFAYVGDSVLGANVNLGAGTKLANVKVATGPRSNVMIKIDGVVFDTGRRKMGSIIGDDSELGCNSVTVPGTLVGPRTLAYPCTVLRGVIPADSVVKLRQTTEIVPKK